jgi:hypothetical protein
MLPISQSLSVTPAAIAGIRDGVRVDLIDAALRWRWEGAFGMPGSGGKSTLTPCSAAFDSRFSTSQCGVSAGVLSMRITRSSFVAC